MDERYPESVAALRAELKRLEDELRTADAAGDRRTALNTLAQMLHLQKRFMSQWAAKKPGHGDDDAADDLAHLHPDDHSGR